MPNTPIHRRYARVGVEQREQFDGFTKDYFLNRPNLTMVFLLIDSSITPQKASADESRSCRARAQHQCQAPAVVRPSEQERAQHVCRLAGSWWCHVMFAGGPGVRHLADRQPGAILHCVHQNRQAEEGRLRQPDKHHAIQARATQGMQTNMAEVWHCMELSCAPQLCNRCPVLLPLVLMHAGV